MKAILALEDGSLFHGEAFGARASACGEVCFNTSMSGYQEILKAADIQNTREQIDYALSRESQSVLSVLRLVPEGERAQLRVQLEPAITRLREFAR